jgi:A/G-specific adenine glycosylase
MFQSGGGAALQMNRESTLDFAEALLAWFDVHGRKDLPWQIDPAPYRVWVSEIMLQQTQVITVIPYYSRFIAHFPHVRALSSATLDEVLYLWSGLGYYARARNLHRAARIVCEQFGGELPTDAEQLQSLPGIGRSTAGAILALSLGRRHAILDGNVKRVLTRVHAIDQWPGASHAQRRLWRLAEAATPNHRVADYTQAIMDLGATLCTRARPGCERCPLNDRCRAYASGQPTAYPRPRPRRPRAARRIRTLLLFNETGEILLERRSRDGIWGGLWSLPEMPADHLDLPPRTASSSEYPLDLPPPRTASSSEYIGINAGAIRDWCLMSLRCVIDDVRALPERRHELTHLSLAIQPVVATVTNVCGLMEGDRYVWYNHTPSHARGMPSPIQHLIEEVLRELKGTGAL